MNHLIRKIWRKLYNEIRHKLNKLLCKASNYRIVLLSEKGRISLFLTSVEPRLRISERSRLKHIFINPYEIPNNFLMQKYSEKNNFIKLDLHKKSFFRVFKLSFWVLLNHFATGKDSRNNYFSTGCLIGEEFNELWSYKPVLKLNNKEIELAEKQLPKFILKDNKPIVLIGYRESGYYEKCINLERSPQGSNIFEFRNPKFEAYIKSIDWLIDNGCIVIKSGISYQNLNYKRDGFIDLSSSKEEYNELLHFYLCMVSKFAINGCCGQKWFSWILNKKSIATHEYELPNYPCVNTTYIPSTYFCKSRDRLLTLSEIRDEVDTTLILNDSINIIHPTDDDILVSTKKIYYEIVKTNEKESESEEMKDIRNSFEISYKSITGENKLPYCIEWSKKYKNLFK